MIRARLLRTSDICMGDRPKESLIAGLALMSMFMTVGGCGFNYTYSKPGVSQQERAKDHYECKQESQKFSAVAMRGTMVAGSDPDWTTYKECLEARGYTVTGAPEEERIRPVTIQVPRTVNGTLFVQYADGTLDLDRVPVEGINVGVVDSLSVLDRNKAGMRDLATLKKYVSERKQQLSQVEEGLRNYEKQLKEQGANLSDAEKKEKETQFQTRIQGYRKQAQEFNDDLVHKQTQLVQNYTERIHSVTAQVASRSGLNLVFDSLAIDPQAKSMLPPQLLELMKQATKDLTQDVIEEFDRTYQ